MSEFVVTAPASSANLGAGFDSVGIGIEIRMTARVGVLGSGASPVWSYGGLHPPTHDGVRRMFFKVRFNFTNTPQNSAE